MKAERGFTLIEAVVAMAVLAAALLPIYALISSSLNGATRLAAKAAEGEHVLNAIEVMAVVNPLKAPKGQIPLGAGLVRWEARRLTEPMDGTAYPRGISLYRLALFDTAVTVLDPEGQVAASFTLRQTGYDRVREPAIPFSAPPQGTNP